MADGRVVIDTELNTKSAEKQAQGLGSSLKSGLAKGAKVAAVGMTAIGTAATAASGAVVKATKATMDYGVEVNRNSQKLNMSKQGYQEWSYVLKRSGTSIDSLRMGMKKISTQIDEAKNGSASATENFKRLGISVDDLKGKSQEEVFGLMVEKLQGIKDTTERSAIANKFFGRSAQEMAGLLNKSGKEVDALKKQAKDLGLVMSDDAIKASAEFRGKITELQSAFEGLRNKMAVQFLPSLTKVTDGLSLIAQGKTDEGLKKIEKGITEFTKKLNEMTPKILALGGTILKSLGKGLLDNLPTLLDAGASIVGAIITGIAKAIPILIKQLPKILDAVAESLNEALDILGSALPSALKPLTGILSGIVSLFNGMVQVLTAQNSLGTVLRGIVIGLTTAFVAYKVAVGLATIAQTAFNLVMNANPIFLVVTAVTALTSAIIAMNIAEEQDSSTAIIDAETEAIKRRTEARQEELNKQNEANTAHQTRINQTQEAINGHIAEANNLKTLVGQLDGLVDAQGNVQKGRESQVDFILNQLNSALGTEYKLVNGQVTEYDKLKNSIYKAIDAKTAELVLQDAEQSYTEAIKKHAEAQKKSEKATKDASEAHTLYKEKLKRNNAQIEQYEKQLAEARATGDIGLVDWLSKKIKKREENTASAKKDYDTAKKIESQASSDAKKYYGEMIRYQSAYQAAASGNNKKAQKILSTSVKEYKKLGGYISEGVANGMTDEEAMKMVTKAANTIGDKGLKALKKKWGIKSPSKVAKEIIGQNIGEGIALGIVDGYVKNDPTKQLSADIMSSMGNLQTSINASMDLKTNIADAVQTGFENANVSMKVGARDFARLTKEAMA